MPETAKDLEKCSDSSRTILLAADASSHCRAAFDFYTDKLWKKGDELVIVHVYQPPGLPGLTLSAAPGGYISSNYFSDLEESVEECKKILENYKKLCEECSISCRLILKSSDGNCGHTLCNVITDVKPVLVVIGTRGLGAVSRFLLGSVSDHVLHHADCSVCVVPHPK